MSAKCILLRLSQWAHDVQKIMFMLHSLGSYFKDLNVY